MLEKIYLIHHTHLDIGYTDLPEEVMSDHLIHMDRVLDFCEKDPDYRWFVESAYLVRDYWNHRGEKARQRLIGCLKSGQLELGAFEMQPLTELLDCRGLFDSIAYSRKFAQSHGFKSETACLDDIGGYAGRLSTVLSEGGIRYFIAGVGAFQVHLPWAKEMPFLFRLRGKDGAEILVWHLAISRIRRPQDETGLHAVYGAALGDFIQPALLRFMQGEVERGAELDFPPSGTRSDDVVGAFRKLEERLAAENYPYREVMIQFGGDNRGPAGYLPELVRRINTLKGIPRVVLVNPSEFFHLMEEKYGPSIPSLTGAITDPWNMRALPAPSGLKTFLRAQRGLTIPEKAVENLQFYADHTCGLSEWGWEKSFRECRARDYDRYRTSWREKSFYADAALREIRRAERELRQRLGEAPHGERLLAVWNRGAVTLSGPVEVYAGRDTAGLSGFTDALTNESCPTQWIGPHRYLVETENVPPFSMKKYVSVPGIESEEHCVAEPVPDEVKTSCFTVRFDSAKGLVAEVLLPDGRSCLARADIGLGMPLVEYYPEFRKDALGAGMLHEDFREAKLEFLGAKCTERGPVRRTVVSRIEAALPNAVIRFEVITSVYMNHPRLDVSVRLDHPETEVKHVIGIGFPFAGPPLNCRISQGLGAIDPGRDLLPGAMQELFCAVGGAEFRSDNVLTRLTLPDAPMISLGKPDLTAWRQDFPFTRPDNTAYGLLYHNLQNTDCPIWQDVLDTFRYSIHFLPAEKENSEGTGADASVLLEGHFLQTGRDIVPESPILNLDRAEGIRFHGFSEGQCLLENTLEVPMKTTLMMNGKEKRVSFQPFELKRIPCPGARLLEPENR